MNRYIILVISIITSIYAATGNNNEVTPYEGYIEKEISLIQELE